MTRLAMAPSITGVCTAFRIPTSRRTSYAPVAVDVARAGKCMQTGAGVSGQHEPLDDSTVTLSL